MHIFTISKKNYSKAQVLRQLRSVMLVLRRKSGTKSWICHNVTLEIKNWSHPTKKNKTSSAPPSYKTYLSIHNSLFPSGWSYSSTSGDRRQYQYFINNWNTGWRRASERRWRGESINGRIALPAGVCQSRATRDNAITHQSERTIDRPCCSVSGLIQ